MPYLLVSLGSMLGWGIKSATDSAATGIQQGAQEATSNMMTYAAIGIGIFVIGKTQKWW